MKGLLNNDEAVKVLEDLIGTERNRIHQIYNLGYKEGYKDAVEMTTRTIDEYVNRMMEKRADGRKKITIERNICPKPECGDEFPIPKEGWKGASDEMPI